MNLIARLRDAYSAVLARVRSLGHGLFSRRDVEAGMCDEFRHHIELRTEDLMREGLSPDEARWQAHREFGHMETHREEARSSRGLRFFDQIRFSWVDVKLGLRMLWKHPGLTIVAVFSLAIGIPVGMAPIHLARAIEAPLPEDDADRIRAIRLWNIETTGTQSPSYFDYAAWRDELSGFEALGAVRSEFVNVTPGGGTPATALGAAITASAFPILRTSAVMGRTLIPADESPGSPDVVVIGYDLWQSRMDGNPDVVGSTLRVGGIAHTIVGVMPEGFGFPVRQQIWLPLQEIAAPEPGAGLGLSVFGRLAPGISPDAAQAEAAAWGQRVASRMPDRYERLVPEVVPFALTMMGIPRGGLDAMPEFYFFQILAVFLLVVPCANVAMLVFARTATRSKELAVRTALGASRLRIVSQVLTEAFVLAVVAAGIGLFSVDWGLGFLRGYAENQAGAPLPYWLDLGVTLEAVVWALGLAALCAVMAGVVPALRVTGKKVQRSIQRAGGARAGTRFGGVTSALIVADVAIAVIVIGFAGGLADRLMVAMTGDDLIGIPAEEYLAVSLTLPTVESPLEDGAGFDRSQFFERLQAVQTQVTERLEAEPGVRSVAAASALPRMDHTSMRIQVERDDETPGVPRYSRYARVDIDYFETLGRPILAGRGFDGSDLTADRSTAIVNEVFVERRLGGRNPVGRRLRVVPRGNDPVDAPWLEIVGVVGHLGVNILNPDGAVYIPAAPGEIHPLRLAVHAGSDPEALSPEVREIVAEVEPMAVLESPVALDRVYQGDWYLVLATTGGLALFLGILVTLAASGIYAIMSFAVSERTREIGIRNALGARRSGIAITVARRALIQLGVGALIGIPLAARFFLFASSGTDSRSVGSATLAAVAAGLAVMAVIGLAACTGPTLRALRIEPTEAFKGVE